MVAYEQGTPVAPPQSLWLNMLNLTCSVCEDRVLDGPASGGKGSKGTASDGVRFAEQRMGCGVKV